MQTKTRVAYGILKNTGELVLRTDTVKDALHANMMVRDYEKKLIALNPQLEITVKVECF